MEGFKSHKNEENYEIPMAKRNKDSTAFFTLLRIRIMSYCKIHMTVLNRNRNEDASALQECISFVTKEAASAKSESVILDDLYPKFLKEAKLRKHPNPLFTIL